MVNVQAAVEAQLFGANLLGMVSREEKEGKIVTQFLVMPSQQEENQAFTVDDVVEEINKTIYKLEHDGEEKSGRYEEPVKTGDIDKALKILGLNNVELTFMQTFVYYKGEKPKDPESVGTKEVTTTEDNTQSGNNGNKNTHLEYAIGIHIKGSEPPSKDFKFLNIKDIYIKVWDTDRQNVLERMKIWTLDQIGEK